MKAASWRRGRSVSHTFNRQSKQLLSSRAGDVLPPQLIKFSLGNLQPLTGFGWSHALHPWTSAHTHMVDTDTENFINPTVHCGHTHRINLTNVMAVA